MRLSTSSYCLFLASHSVVAYGQSQYDTVWVESRNDGSDIGSHVQQQQEPNSDSSLPLNIENSLNFTSDTLVKPASGLRNGTDKDGDTLSRSMPGYSMQAVHLALAYGAPAVVLCVLFMIWSMRRHYRRQQMEMFVRDYCRSDMGTDRGKKTFLVVKLF